MLSIFFSAAEKNGGIRKTKQSETHTLQTLLNKLLVLDLPSADEG